MTVAELNSLINDNVYENTEQAITGGKLQTVLQGMMGAFFGTNYLSGLGSLLTKDMQDAIGSTLGSNYSLISSLVPKIATDSTFRTNLVQYFRTYLSTDSTFGSCLAGLNSTFTMSLVSQIATKIATASGFENSLNCRYNFYSGTIPYDLALNTQFISALKSALGI